MQRSVRILLRHRPNWWHEPVKHGPIWLTACHVITASPVSKHRRYIEITITIRWSLFNHVLRTAQCHSAASAKVFVFNLACEGFLSLQARLVLQVYKNVYNRLLGGFLPLSRPLLLTLSLLILLKFLIRWSVTAFFSLRNCLSLCVLVQLVITQWFPITCATLWSPIGGDFCVFINKKRAAPYFNIFKSFRHSVSRMVVELQPPLWDRFQTWRRQIPDLKATDSRLEGDRFRSLWDAT